MIKIRYLSDLHIDFKQFVLEPSDHDIVILAGDIAGHYKKSEKFLKTIKQPTLVVAGNHDYYDKPITEKLEDYYNTEHTIFLNNNNHKIVKDEITYNFIGSTLWSGLTWIPPAKNGYIPMREKMELSVEVGINDFHHIPSWTLQSMLNCYEESYHYIKDEVYKSVKKKEIPIVISHYPPTNKFIHPNFIGSIFNSYFLNDCEELTKNVPLWFCGHTHTTIDGILDTGCRVLCNPHGYRNENKEFDSHKEVILE
jgi:predicted phosphohydrolase